MLASAAETLDLSQPVAVMALMIPQYVPDEDDPWDCQTGWWMRLPRSYLIVSDTVRDIDTQRVSEAQRG